MPIRLFLKYDEQEINSGMFAIYTGLMMTIRFPSRKMEEMSARVSDLKEDTDAHSSSLTATENRRKLSVTIQTIQAGRYSIQTI